MKVISYEIIFILLGAFIVSIQFIFVSFAEIIQIKNVKLSNGCNIPSHQFISFGDEIPL